MFPATVKNKAKTLQRSDESRDVKDGKGLCSHPVYQFSEHSPLLPFLTDFFHFGFIRKLWSVFQIFLWKIIFQYKSYSSSVFPIINFGIYILIYSKYS